MNKRFNAYNAVWKKLTKELELLVKNNLFLPDTSPYNIFKINENQNERRKSKHIEQVIPLRTVHNVVQESSNVSRGKNV